ncbi:5170_t:CDS:2, partial [Funneliformis geosporum]
MPEQIRKNIFWPSFGDLLTDFDVIIKCVVCYAFAKKSAYDLCDVCLFYVNAEGQMEVIVNYLGDKDTFVSMKTSRGKTLCYAVSAICFDGLTIIFSPLKALIKDQKLIKIGILCAALYANLLQEAHVQEKFFEEIACELIKMLFVTPEKLRNLEATWNVKLMLEIGSNYVTYNNIYTIR